MEVVQNYHSLSKQHPLPPFPSPGGGHKGVEGKGRLRSTHPERTEGGMDSLPRGLGGGGLGLLSDVCLLCGFSVARRSAKGAADGRVCYLCASATGQDGDVWRLPLVLRKAGVAEADVVRATERAVARANAAFDEDADELVLRAAGGGGGGGGGGGQTSLPRTLCSLREARLNSRVLRAFFQPSSGKEGAMARERAVLPFNPAKNGVVVTAERVSASDVECYVRLGRVRALEAWPAYAFYLFHFGFFLGGVESAFFRVAWPC